MKELLIKCAELCKEAYDDATIEDKYTDTQVLVKDNVIAWRGTENVKDWCTDLKVHYHKTNYGYVHGGFHDSYESVCDLLPRDEKVIITGHSLGGALAVLNGIDFLESGVDVEAIITFGQPRCLSIPTAARIKRKNLAQVGFAGLQQLGAVSFWSAQCVFVG